MLDDDSFIFKLLNSIDFFHVWWVMVLSIGLAVVWQRRTAPIATSLYVVYGGFVVAAAVLRATLGF